MRRWGSWGGGEPVGPSSAKRVSQNRPEIGLKRIQNDDGFAVALFGQHLRIDFDLVGLFGAQSHAVNSVAQRERDEDRGVRFLHVGNEIHFRTTGIPEFDKELWLDVCERGLNNHGRDAGEAGKRGHIGENDIRKSYGGSQTKHGNE